jgi:putative hydrolase of HD superfamily
LWDRGAPGGIALDATGDEAAWRRTWRAAADVARGEAARHRARFRDPRTDSGDGSQMVKWRGKGCGRLLAVLLEANELKTIPRMGWRVRGVTDGESVAEHSYSVALISMILADRMDIEVDKEKLLRIALLHDLSEHMLGDIHAPATKLLGEEEKERAEERVLRQLFEGIDEGERYVELWKEFADRTSVEGRLVRAVDKLEMFTQAYQYESAGNRMLDDFWGWEGNMRDFDFDEIQRLYDELLELRRSDRGRDRD